MRKVGLVLLAVLVAVMVSTVVFADTRPAPGPWPEAQA